MKLSRALRAEIVDGGGNGGRYRPARSVMVRDFSIHGRPFRDEWYVRTPLCCHVCRAPALFPPAPPGHAARGLLLSLHVGVPRAGRCAALPSLRGGWAFFFLSMACRSRSRTPVQ